MRCSIEFSANQIDHRHRLGLVLAPGAGDALLEFGRIPRQVHVDHRRGDLQVEADTAGIGGKKQLAGGIVLEPPDFQPAAVLRYRAGMPGEFEAHLDRQFAHQLEHPFPLGEDDHLAPGLGQQLGEDVFQLVELGRTRQAGSRI